MDEHDKDVMDEHDEGITRDLKHEQREDEDSEALRYQRTSPEGPRAARDTLATFAESRAIYATASNPAASRPRRGEPDTRPVWDAEEVLAHVPVLIAALRDICPDGTILAGDRKALAYGVVHSLHRQVVRLTKRTDSMQRALQRAADAGPGDKPDADADINAAIADYQNAHARAKAFERIFSTAAGAYRRDFGEVWAPSRSTYTLRSTTPAGRILTPAQFRGAPRELKAQQTRPSALADRAARYDVPERVLARSDVPDAETLYRQLRADWKALDDRARAAGIHISAVDGYPDLQRRARELAERSDLPSLADARLAAFLAGTDDPPAPARAAPEPAEAAPSEAPPTPFEPVAEPDSWDPERATRALDAIVDILKEDILAEGTQLRDDLEPVLWSLANCFDRHASDLRHAIDRLEDSPTAEREALETHIAELSNRLEAFETLHDYVAAAHNEIKPPELERSADERKKAPRDTYIDPGEARGPHVAVSGAKNYHDFDTVFRALSAERARHPDMVLVHGGASKGAVPIARSWARNYGVDQVVLRPAWPPRDPDAPKPSREETRRINNAAAKARNDQILALNPVAVLSFDAPGYKEHIAEHARERGIRVEAFIDPSLPTKLWRGRSEPAPAPEAPPASGPAADAPWDKEPPAVIEYETFLKDSQRHYAEAQAAGIHPNYHHGADALHRRAANLRGKDYLPDDDRAAIEAFCHRVKAFNAARNVVAELDRDLQKQTKEEFVRQVHVAPTPDRDTPLLHRSETPEYPAWAKETDAILPRAAKIADDPDTYRPHLDHAPDVRERIEQNTEILAAVRANDTRAAPAEALLADLRERSLAIGREAHADEISWIDHRGTPELLRHAELLSRREDLTPDRREAVAHVRTQYDSAVEARKELHRLADDIDAHLGALSDLRIAAAEKRLHTTEHPEYGRWAGRVDDLQRTADRVASETKRYGAHLRADPALRSRIEGTAQILVSTRDNDLRSARMLPPVPTPAPEPAVKRAPSVERAPELAPEPEPLPPAAHEHVPAPEPGISPSP